MTDDTKTLWIGFGIGVLLMAGASLVDHGVTAGWAFITLASVVGSVFTWLTQMD